MAGDLLDYGPTGSGLCGGAPMPFSHDLARACKAHTFAERLNLSLPTSASLQSSTRRAARFTHHGAN